MSSTLAFYVDASRPLKSDIPSDDLHTVERMFATSVSFRREVVILPTLKMKAGENAKLEFTQHQSPATATTTATTLTAAISAANSTPTSCLAKFQELVERRSEFPGRYSVVYVVFLLCVVCCVLLFHTPHFNRPAFLCG